MSRLITKFARRIHREREGAMEPTWGAFSRKDLDPELRPIHQSDSHNQGKNVANIIFVDDLTSAQKRTWPAISQPSEIGRGRLFEYVYDAPVATMTDIVSMVGVTHHAQRLLMAVGALRYVAETSGPLPIIFVAHGFGGLICERALVIAQRDRQNIFHWIRGIILLNTPHYRAGIAEWATMSARATGVVRKVKPKVWKGLKYQFDKLVAMQDEFRDLVKVRNNNNPRTLIRVACCFELLHDTAEDFMLSPEWAILPEFHAFKLRSDRSVTAPESSNDQKVNHLTDELLGWIKELADTEHCMLLNAIQEGNWRDKQQLLARGVDKYRALRAAVEEGHGNLVQKLLSECFEFDGYGNVLVKASQEENEKVLRVVLKYSTKFDRSRALLAASERGHENMVQVLLDDSAHFNAQSDTYVGKGGALQSASFRGNQEEVRMLLREGADVNARGGYFDTALQATSVKGNEKIVQQLLEKGAYVESYGSFFNESLEKEEEKVTPLYTASCQGYAVVVNILVDNGAEVNVKGGSYGNPLQAASSGGYESVVRQLLHNGANVNAQGGVFGTALQAGSSMGHENIVQLLIENHANVNQGSCLLVASEGGHENIVRLLLNSGAGRDQDHCLLAALRSKHETVAQILLENGAYSGDALEIASECGYLKVVELLLLDKRVKDHIFSALCAALRAGHRNVVKVLLEIGAKDVLGEAFNLQKTRGNYGNTS